MKRSQLLAALGLCLMFSTVHAQDSRNQNTVSLVSSAPLSELSIAVSLSKGLPSAALMADIRQRGLGFTYSGPDEEEFRGLGASTEVLQTLRSAREFEDTNTYVRWRRISALSW